MPEEKRYKIKWVDQNVVAVEDRKIDGLFYMNGCGKMIQWIYLL